MEIEKDWQRISAWHAAHSEPGKFQLNPGSSPERFARFEEATGLRIPLDFRESLLLHDGGNSECWILWYGEFLSLEGGLRQWNEYRKWSTQGAGFDWDARHVPITDNSGTHLVVDMGPSQDDRFGQVLVFEHESERPVVVAPSWSAFLSKLATDLEQGKYVYFPEEETVGLPGMW